MTFVEILITAVVAIVASDIVLGAVLGRCVIPGLKCETCRDR